MPKHRLSGAPVESDEFWPEAVGYGQPAVITGRAGAHARGRPVPSGYPDSDSYDEYYGDGYGRDGYDRFAADPGWAARSEPYGWTERPDWRDWGPPPALYPDHPSAPVPRVRLPADHPSGPMPAAYDPGFAPRPQRRSGGSDRHWNAPPRTDDGYGNRRLYAVPDERIAPDRADHEARAQVAEIREAAERDAAAIREAAEREAAELLTRLDSMSGELRRVAAYVIENLGAPMVTATAPAIPDTRPAKPDSRPAKPDVKQPAPAKPGAKPPAPAKPKIAPDQSPQKRPRQQQAMRVAVASTAALLSFAVLSGVTEAGVHGFKFFVFRAGGIGSTGGNEDDQQFLAREAAAAHHATPKGRHARKSDHVVVHHR